MITKTKNKNINQKVLVALSGGIDSAVAAALLKKQGFDVSGAFMIIHDNFCFSEAQKNSQKIAKKLNIPFFVFDLRKEFQKKIINYFLKELESGLTPNPCVICNKKIKFGLLLKKVLAFGADYLATGHYARLQRASLKPNSKNFKIKLLKGKDKNKDQSYFLWQLNQNQLRRIIFPLGKYTKKEVKKIAKKLGLPVVNIPESQEICFIKNNLKLFLENKIKKKWGQVLNENNVFLGKHPGIHFFTIGQRKNIVPYLKNKWKSKGPYFVFKKDKKNNIVFVTSNEKKLNKKELIVKKVNWISGSPPKTPIKILAKIRYNHQPAKATIEKMIDKKYYKIVFDFSQKSLTPGQSIVFYQKEEVLGGGIIN